MEKPITKRKRTTKMEKGETKTRTQRSNTAKKKKQIKRHPKRQREKSSFNEVQDL